MLKDMNFLQKLSLKNRLIFIILTTTLITAIIGFSIVITSHIQSLKNDMINNIEMEGRLIGEYSVTPLTFDDKQGAIEVLNKLNSVPSIIKGELYDEHRQFVCNVSMRT